MTVVAQTGTEPIPKDFNEQELAKCIVVGKIAMRMNELKDKGLDKKFIEAGLNEELGSHLSLWVKPISKIIFSEQNESSKILVKQAIGYCFRVMKTHKNIPDIKYVEA